MTGEYVERLLSLRAGDDRAFDALARLAFRYQRQFSSVYRAYCDALNTADPVPWQEAPALPIAAFKLGTVATFDPVETQAVFSSSGTSGMTVSRHHVRDLSIYRRLSAAAFSSVFGSGPFRFMAHLPGYAQLGKESSLVYMVNHLIDRFGSSGSGSFLENEELLEAAITRSIDDDTPLLLFGSAFGLLHLADSGRFRMPRSSMVIETGGMKTRRAEIARQELHDRLAGGFGLARRQVCSEYGMCELVSQAYAVGGGEYVPPPWMRVVTVDPLDPSRLLSHGESGLLQIVDLGNLHTVSFVLTEDLGRTTPRGFEVLGRVPGSQLRGCNLLLET